jgi:pimeloyl-ACP methyl ester carboxylesterase
VEETDRGVAPGVEQQLHAHAPGLEHYGRPNEIDAKANCASIARLNGLELEYVRLDGDPASPTLVFLHEGLGSITAWRDFPQRLCAQTGLRGLIYTRYGNGFSSVLREKRTASYMHDEALQTLPALLEQLAVESTMLIGHSDGASIAMLYAAEYPQLVRGLVLEAPHLFVEKLSVRSIAGIRTEYCAGLRERLARHHADPDATFFGWNDIWLSPEFAGWNIEEAVQRLAAPVLAIQGRDDQYGTLAQIDALVRHHHDTDALLLAHCGHAPHRERTALVVAAVAGWTQERVRGTATAERGADATRRLDNRTAR